ncbi:MAG: GNAT family N-acetyltransferase [Treponema sp.]
MFTLRQADISDIDAVMRIEKESFDSAIMERREVFMQRLNVFPEGFIVFEYGKNRREVGYICTELWEHIPNTQDFFAVGHDIKALHHAGGSVLYISSFALLKEFRGAGNGKLLFGTALNFFKKNLIAETALLMVNEEWIAARRIYESYGFREYMIFDSAFPAASGKEFSRGIIMKKTLR